MVYKKLSDIMYRKIILPKGVDEKYQEVYKYGFEVLLSSLVNILILILLSYILGIIAEMFCFLLTFIPLRFYGHGAHASTHTRCLVFFSLCMVTAIFTAAAIADTAFYAPVVLTGLICCLYIQFRFATDKRGKPRYKSRNLKQFAFPWLICLVTGTALLITSEPKYTIISALGIYIQSISLIIKKERKNYEKSNSQINVLES